jgi:hypothetical protein
VDGQSLHALAGLGGALCISMVLVARWQYRWRSRFSRKTRLLLGMSGCMSALVTLLSWPILADSIGVGMFITVVGTTWLFFGNVLLSAFGSEGI